MRLSLTTLPALVLLLSTAASAQDQCTTAQPTNDALADTRVLRRVWLTLQGTTPPVEDYEALNRAATPAARQAIIDSTVDTLLQSTGFYEQMVQFGHEWIRNGLYTAGAQGDGYQGDMSGHIWPCPGGTAHAGQYYLNNDYDAPYLPNYNPQPPPRLCNDLDHDGNAKMQPTATREPWWAPGTSITIVGAIALDARTLQKADGGVVDCGIAAGGYYDPDLPQGCGCGPNLIWCAPLKGTNDGRQLDLVHAQRAHPFEEPARLVAHLVWHDRDLSDVVLGNYSVGTNWLRHLYVRWGRQLGPAAADQNTSWWRPAADQGPRDPLHPNANDPQAWREFVVEDLNPYLLALTPGGARGGGLGRTMTYDPRTTTAPPPGLPTAGVLTMMGPNSSWPRERVRAARFLEAFTCSSLTPPPAGAVFAPYVDDPARGGVCSHCHRTLDPVAIAFKRWDFAPHGQYGGAVPFPILGGVGRWRITAAWLSGQYPHSRNDKSPGFRWRNAFLPGTVMTPVTAAQVAANPEAVLMDSVPAGYTLFGQPADSTMGPLGFARSLVQSGEFDRCAVRRLYERVVGRDLQPEEERLYLDALVQQFVQDGRRVRPFIKHLMRQPEFRRGL